MGGELRQVSSCYICFWYKIITYFLLKDNTNRQKNRQEYWLLLRPVALHYSRLSQLTIYKTQHTIWLQTYIHCLSLLQSSQVPLLCKMHHNTASYPSSHKTMSYTLSPPTPCSLCSFLRQGFQCILQRVQEQQVCWAHARSVCPWHAHPPQDCQGAASPFPHTHLQQSCVRERGRWRGRGRVK